MSREHGWGNFFFFLVVVVLCERALTKKVD